MHSRLQNNVPYLMVQTAYFENAAHRWITVLSLKKKPEGFSLF